MIKEAFGEESMSHKRVFDLHVQNHRPKNARQVISKAKSVFIIFFTSRGLFAKKIFDQKQHDVIPHPPCFSQFP
jgi:hypothetical protein